MANETISEKCETLYNKLNSFVTSVINRDVTPKISNLNTEVWGSDTQTGNSRIDTLNTNFNNLDSSITTMESDINNVESDVSNLQTSVNSLSDSITNNTQLHQTKINMNGNFHFVNPTSYTLYRVGHIVIATLWNAQCKPVTNGWVNIAGIPNGYKPIADVFGAVTGIGQPNITQVSTNDKNTIRGYVESKPSNNIWWGFLFVWVTNDDYPS